MSILRSDGSYEIYRIQHKDSQGRWIYSSLDFFGAPPGFSPSGDCWQVTGIDGTFDLAQAMSGLTWISSNHPTRCFRVVKITVVQKTTPVATMHGVEE